VETSPWSQYLCPEGDQAMACMNVGQVDEIERTSEVIPLQETQESALRKHGRSPQKKQQGFPLFISNVR
jgi:hypothetical protein